MLKVVIGLSRKYNKFKDAGIIWKFESYLTEVPTKLQGEQYGTL